MRIRGVACKCCLSWLIVWFLTFLPLLLMAKRQCSCFLLVATRTVLFIADRLPSAGSKVRVEKMWKSLWKAMVLSICSTSVKSKRVSELVIWKRSIFRFMATEGKWSICWLIAFAISAIDAVFNHRFRSPQVSWTGKSPNIKKVECLIWIVVALNQRLFFIVNQFQPISA